MWHALVTPRDLGNRGFSAPEGSIFGKIMTTKISFLLLFFLQSYKLRPWEVCQQRCRLASRENLQLAPHIGSDLLWAGPWDPAGTFKDGGEHSKQLMASVWQGKPPCTTTNTNLVSINLHSGWLNTQLLLGLQLAVLSDFVLFCLGCSWNSGWSPEIFLQFMNLSIPRCAYLISIWNRTCVSFEKKREVTWYSVRKVW